MHPNKLLDPNFILLNSLTNFNNKHLINNIDDNVYQTMANTHTLIMSFILYFCNTIYFLLKIKPNYYYFRFNQQITFHDFYNVKFLS